MLYNYHTAGYHAHTDTGLDEFRVVLYLLHLPEVGDHINIFNAIYRYYEGQTAMASGVVMPFTFTTLRYNPPSDHHSLSGYGLAVPRD